MLRLSLLLDIKELEHPVTEDMEAVFEMSNELQLLL